jgi:hypothetical protein
MSDTISGLQSAYSSLGNSFTDATGLSLSNKTGNTANSNLSNQSSSSGSTGDSLLSQVQALSNNLSNSAQQVRPQTTQSSFSGFASGKDVGPDYNTGGQSGTNLLSSIMSLSDEDAAALQNLLSGNR